MTEQHNHGPHRVEGNDTSGYVGVDPEYRNYANETDKPIISEEQRRVMQEAGILADDEIEAQRGDVQPSIDSEDPEQGPEDAPPYLVVEF